MGNRLLKKESRRYEAFLYWWDISPALAKSLDEYDEIELIKKDTNESCKVQVVEQKKFLTKERQTNRGDGNWGIKVLMEHPDELAFEPRHSGEGWLFLPVVWHVQGQE